MFRSRIMIYLCVALGAGAVWYFFFQSVPIINAPPKAGPIVAFGDSLTAGNGASAGQAYPDQLAGLIGRPVLNCGVSGNTVEEAEGRLAQDVLAQNPGIVIVLLGGNDMLQQLDLDQSFTRLEGMIRRIQGQGGQGAMVILVGLNGLSPIGGMGGRYKSLARRTGCVYVPNILGGIFANRPLMSDEIHPNDKGYRIMAERLATVLRPYL